MSRILTPKVHVEVFRPNYIIPKTRDREGRETERLTSLKSKFRLRPNELTYIRIAEIEDRRVKGIQFEETALFGGFIELNIAEDPTSELFDKFTPNDHVEVFYDDVENLEKAPIFSTNANKEFNYLKSPPKFQGASWKTDLKYRPTMVTTQLHAWDYLRLLQYINIPRGKKQPEPGLSVEPASTPDPRVIHLKTRIQNEQYGDNFLDYVDSAFDKFSSSGEISIFGEQTIPVEIQDERNDIIKQGLKFSSTRNTRDGKRPRVRLFTAGIGEHCHERIRDHKHFGKFKEVQFTDGTWSSKNYHKENSPDKIITNIQKTINKMGTHDMFLFRFLDGKFERFGGVNEDEEVTYVKATDNELVMDIIVISQFALMELLVKKITYDHGINEWFTPVIKLDQKLLDSITNVGEQIGQRVSKLVYVRIRKAYETGEESSSVVFNMDTFPFITETTMEIFKRAAGNLRSTSRNKMSDSLIDIFTEIISSTQFPQPKSDSENTYSLETLVDSMAGYMAVSNHQEVYRTLLSRFDLGFSPTVYTNFDGSSDPIFFREMLHRATQYLSLIQKILRLDDKLVSFIAAIPASFMRADIYTGSKFNTMQYDSLAITRIIQILTSTVAGFPLTNNPESNTETGSIDSYPIFAANRIVIKPKAFFGVQTVSTDSNTITYDLFSSLTDLFKQNNNKDQVKATCFLILDVGKKQLKDKGEDPDFIFPMEDIQDFGMIKASTVNHYFNFSMEDQIDKNLFLNSFDNDITLSSRENNRLKDIFTNVMDNGFFIQYREEDTEMAGYSPPEHQHMTLSDLTQNESYNSWKVRVTVNTNTDESTNSSKPIVNPSRSFTTQHGSGSQQIMPGENTHKIYNINNYDEFKSLTGVSWRAGAQNESKIVDVNAEPIEGAATTEPFHGIETYIDISDLKVEYETLFTILEDEDLAYSGITNVGTELMKNIYIRVPLSFTINKDERKYSEKIKLTGIAGGAIVGEFRRIYDVVKDIVEQLRKIDEIDMHWLFPYSGSNINPLTGLVEEDNIEQKTNLPSTTVKHLNLIVYLDLLIKAIRYILWSLAKARFFAHVYLPIEYEKYSKSKGNMNPSDLVVEPGSSVQITYDKNNSLNKSIDPPLVSFSIKGLESGSFQPLTRTIARATSSENNFIKVEEEKARELTWYVSKKVTYIGADVGAMMRVEMTEGSLDWTLFYNEKNLLTQVSEHYLLNGLGNFRAGGVF